VPSKALARKSGPEVFLLLSVLIQGSQQIKLRPRQALALVERLVCYIPRLGDAAMLGLDPGTRAHAQLLGAHQDDECCRRRGACFAEEPELNTGHRLSLTLGIAKRTTD